VSHAGRGDIRAGYRVRRPVPGLSLTLFVNAGRDWHDAARGPRFVLGWVNIGQQLSADLSRYVQPVGGMGVPAAEHWLRNARRPTREFLTRTSC